MVVVFSGLAAGAAHVVSGPDHLAAVAPIAADAPARATQLGFRWGLGHGLGAASLGLLGVLARGWVDLHLLSEWAEFIVGFALIAVGVWALRKMNRPASTSHKSHDHAALWVGLLHGAAGTGHVLAVLPSLALPTGEAVVYLASYFVAAVVAMTGFGAAMGAVASRGRAGQLRVVMAGASVSAIAIGLFWIVTAV